MSGAVKNKSANKSVEPIAAPRALLRLTSPLALYSYFDQEWGNSGDT